MRLIVSKRLWVVTVFAAVSVASLWFGVAPRQAHGQQAPEVAIDADISDGACTDIDASRSVVDGTTGVQVAVCLVTNPNGVPVAAINYTVTYNDAVVQAPEVADAGTALDDNPDANAGATTFSSPNLGGGWDCSGGVGAYPKGDSNPATGAGNGAAYSGGCGSAAGPNTLVTGPLGVITFNAVGVGTSSLSLVGASVTDNDLLEIGSCNPTGDVAMTCTGASIDVTSSGGPTSTPTRTPASTATPRPTSTPCAGGRVCLPTPITPAASWTPGATEVATSTPVPGQTQAPTPPGGTTGPGGAPGGGLVGPDTGTGPEATNGWLRGWFVPLAAAGGLLILLGTGGRVLGARTRRERRAP